ncbi:MAG: GDSL-type esterase/lipase family protein [Roseateles sp.]|uniref:GDSL-type esterase/lipase family protein n=1 Tax=Roseateles sp. TaxID=1971397 RepID=UPI004036D4FF
MNACPNVLRRSLQWLALVTALAGCAAPLPPSQGEGWSAAWGTALLAQPVPQAGAGAVAPLWRQPMRDVSLRQVVRVSAAGSVLRVRISNLFGNEPLIIGSASVARVSALEPQPVLDAGSLRPLSFGGRRDLSVPAGGEVWSDPVKLALPALADVALQLHVEAGPSQASVHPGSRIRSWAVPGNRARTLGWPDAVAQEGWWHLAAIDVHTPKPLPVLVATGDSITDGYGVPSGSYQRWTDMLAARLAAAKRDAAVINTGIGGGRLLREGLGPSLVSRFDRDVLARSGATHALVLIGVNDLGVSHRGRATTPASRAALLAELKAGFADLAGRARAKGVCLIGATVMPYAGSGYYAPKAENEADRQALNDWLREPGRFDALLDFDALMRDPARPTHLRAVVDNDGLHPSLAGYRVMAEAFPLELLDRRCAKVSGP